MRIVAAGFTTALLVFAVATAISEMSLIPDTTPSNDAPARPRSRTAKTTNDSVRSSRGTSRNQKAAFAAQNAAEPQTVEAPRQPSALRQRESNDQAEREANQLVLDDIREAQRNVDLFRRQVSDELAALHAAALRVAQRDDAIIARDLATTLTEAASVAVRTNARPVVSLRDRQAVRDAAVLVNQLAKQGDDRGAKSYLRRLKDRDSTKVLTELSATNPELAWRLSDGWLAARDEATSRR